MIKFIYTLWLVYQRLPTSKLTLLWEITMFHVYIIQLPATASFASFSHCSAKRRWRGNQAWFNPPGGFARSDCEWAGHTPSQFWGGKWWTSKFFWGPYFQKNHRYQWVLQNIWVKRYLGSIAIFRRSEEIALSNGKKTMVSSKISKFWAKMSNCTFHTWVLLLV